MAAGTTMILEDRNIDLVSPQNVRVFLLHMSLNHIFCPSCQIHMGVLMPKEDKIRIHHVAPTLACKCECSTPGHDMPAARLVESR